MRNSSSDSLINRAAHTLSDFLAFGSYYLTSVDFGIPCCKTSFEHFIALKTIAYTEVNSTFSELQRYSNN